MCQNLYIHIVLMVAIVASNGITKSHYQSNRGIKWNYQITALSSARSDPCRPSPCGPNTSCHARGSGFTRAQCRCLDGFVPDRNTIDGCKPQCTRDADCPNDYRCQSNKCVKVCQTGACGLNADCFSRNHRAICECPRGYQGRPEFRCTRSSPVITPTTHNPVQRLDQCDNACGEGAHCEVVQRRARCSCPQFYIGNPYTRCYPECTRHNDCPSYQACYQFQCVNPCDKSIGVCGVGAECRVQNHKPICSCPRGYAGHPFEGCYPTTQAFPPVGCEGQRCRLYRNLN